MHNVLDLTMGMQYEFGQLATADRSRRTASTIAVDTLAGMHVLICTSMVPACSLMIFVIYEISAATTKIRSLTRVSSLTLTRRWTIVAPTILMQLLNSESAIPPGVLSSTNPSGISTPLVLRNTTIPVCVSLVLLISV